MEFDFYGKKLTQDILEYLFQELISNPLAYGDILDVLESLIMVQTKDTFTQNALNQIVALASASFPFLMDFNFQTFGGSQFYYVEVLLDLRDIVTTKQWTICKPILSE